MLFESTDVSLNTITVLWFPPSEENGVIVAYEVSHTFCGTTTTFNSSDTFLELTGLDPGTRVSFIVRAFTICEGGPPSTVSLYTNGIRKCYNVCTIKKYDSIHVCTF